MMLLLGTAMFAVFFFLTIYVQTVWGYSPVRAGLAWVPFPIALIAINIFVARVLVAKVGVRPLLMAGPLFAGAGFMWLSRLSPTGSYWTDLLAPMLVLALGMGLMFVPLTLMVVSHVRHDEAGAASSLLNIGQQVGGSIGLAAIGTIAWTSVANTVRDSMAAAAASGAAQGAGGSAAGAGEGAASIPPAILFHGLTVGFSTGLVIAGVVALSGFVVAVVTTWTPGRFRLRSARHDREPSCDEVLGTCEAAALSCGRRLSDVRTRAGRSRDRPALVRRSRRPCAADASYAASPSGPTSFQPACQVQPCFICRVMLSQAMPSRWRAIVSPPASTGLKPMASASPSTVALASSSSPAT